MTSAMTEEARLAKLLKTVKFSSVVSLMTNHERTLWARDGYKGLTRKEPHGPARFLSGALMLERLKPELEVPRTKRSQGRPIA